MKYWGSAFLTVAVLVNAAFGAWHLSGDPGSSKVVLGIFNLGVGAFCAVVLGKILADWQHL